MSSLPDRVSSLVIGAGPAGLTAAASLARAGVDVRVVDRDDAPGGVPRHSDHPGYGLRGMRRVLSGPQFAQRLTDRAADAGARIDVRTTVTDLDRNRHVNITSPAGREGLTPSAIVLATGCRERPRTARLVPGTRPAGILTTGWLQRLVNLQHGNPGARAVVVGAEHVSYSAVLTLAEAGCRTVAMVTDRDAHDSVGAFDLLARTRYSFPLLTNARITAIHGRERVTGVSLQRDDGATAHIDCDTVVFTGDWFPENDLAVRAGLPLAMGSHAPNHDGSLRTTAPGIFAAGNLLHPAITADRCADDGDIVSDAVVHWLNSQHWPTPAASIEVEAPLRWVSPTRLDGPIAGPVWLLSDERRRTPRIEVVQADEVLWSGRVPWARPTRPFRILGAWAARANADEPICIRFAT